MLNWQWGAFNRLKRRS
uniref:Uncharacterized protein n=1 Tax=Arundo donax TaxID=35708 RepID=A0A0A8ZAQ1_ARUDO